MECSREVGGQGSMCVWAAGGGGEWKLLRQDGVKHGVEPGAESSLPLWALERPHKALDSG